MTEPALQVRPISTDRHLAYIDAQDAVSFLQTPSWARVKSEWASESLGWFRDASSLGSSTQGFRRGSTSGEADELVGAALVLYRQLPRMKRYLAYLPEGPVIDWSDDGLECWLAPMVTHLKARRAFGVRMGPPVVTRRWDAKSVKEGIASDGVRRLGDVPPTTREPVGARVVSQLTRLGWRHQQVEGGFGAGQPQYVFAIPLRHDDGTPRTEEEVLRGMNQQWRRNIKKATKAGVAVTRGARADLPAFHALYAHTAERDGFTPRPLSYFETMYDALTAEHDSRIGLHLAHHEGDLVAATISTRVGRHYWYSYGASATEKRDVRASNAVQWAMIRDALESGCDVYDLRGITDTLDPDDGHVGLMQFKVGTGGQALEYVGEWDLPINRALYKAFDVYMKRRG